MIKKFSKILVVSLQGIGDLLLVTPLLKGLKENLPEAKISILTFKANKDILTGNPSVDEIFCFEPKNFIKILTLLFAIRKKHFDLSICTYPTGLRSAFMGYLSGVPVRFGQDLSIFNRYRWLFTKQTPVTKVKHAVLMNLDFLKLLEVNTKKANTELILNFSDENKNFARKFLRTNNIKDKDLLITIHAGGGKYTVAYRCWPKERFAFVADALIEKFGAKILFIGGKDDVEVVKQILGIMTHKAVSMTGKASLKQTAALISKSHLLICNNSAPMHMAAALKIHTVSIFGSVDSRIHRPWGEGHIVLQKNLECSPCYYPFLRDTLEETKKKNRWFDKTFKCLKKNYECFTLIATDNVIRAVENILGKREDDAKKI